MHFDAADGKQKNESESFSTPDGKTSNKKSVFLRLYSRLLHLDLLCVSLLVVQFGLQTDQLPGFVGALVRLTALLLPLLLMVVQAVAVPLTVQLDVLVLGLNEKIQNTQFS